MINPDSNMILDQKLLNSLAMVPSPEFGDALSAEASKPATDESRNEDIAKFVKYIESLGIKVHKQSKKLNEIRLPGTSQHKAKLFLDISGGVAPSTVTEPNQAETKTVNASVLQSEGHAAGPSQHASVRHNSPVANPDGTMV